MNNSNQPDGVEKGISVPNLDFIDSAEVLNVPLTESSDSDLDSYLPDVNFIENDLGLSQDSFDSDSEVTYNAEDSKSKVNSLFNGPSSIFPGQKRLTSKNCAELWELPVRESKLSTSKFTSSNDFNNQMRRISQWLKTSDVDVENMIEE